MASNGLKRPQMASNDLKITSKWPQNDFKWPQIAFDFENEEFSRAFFKLEIVHKRLFGTLEHVCTLSGGEM